MIEYEKNGICCVWKRYEVLCAEKVHTGGIVVFLDDEVRTSNVIGFGHLGTNFDMYSVPC